MNTTCHLADQCKLWTIYLAICLSMIACQASDLLVVDEVQYNFKTEGFLSHQTLQTIGQANFNSYEYGTDHARRACLQDAKNLARQRMLRVLLHTHFEIPGQSNATLLDQDSFESDYPVQFSPGEYVRAELAFTALLSRSFVALEDARSRNNCSVVLRLAGEDLPEEIREQNIPFTPRGLAHPDRRTH